MFAKIRLNNLKLTDNKKLSSVQKKVKILLRNNHVYTTKQKHGHSTCQFRARVYLYLKSIEAMRE